MRVKLKSVGQSVVVLIPRSMLTRCGIRREAEVFVAQGQLIVTRTRRARQGWDRMFREKSANQDDRLLATPSPLFDEDDWQW